MIILIDKEAGITSYDVIRKLKKQFPGQKIGHSGTLDPMATGLMIVGVGKDTKKLPEYQGLDKTYITQIDFSKDSDTRDTQYRKEFQEFKVKQDTLIINEQHKKFPSIQQLQNKLDLLIPEFELPLTPFSAKKVKGKKLYDLARKGEEIKLNKVMKINNYKILDYSIPILQLEISVGSGTYIRSIGHWLGKQFELGGILVSLRRVVVGNININNYKFQKEDGVKFYILEK